MRRKLASEKNFTSMPKNMGIMTRWVLKPITIGRKYFRFLAPLQNASPPAPYHHATAKPKEIEKIFG